MKYKLWITIISYKVFIIINNIAVDDLKPMTKYYAKGKKFYPNLTGPGEFDVSFGVRFGRYS